jgi:nucleotide-binding universal stress UspA family protein
LINVIYGSSMQKHFLITVSSDRHNLTGVEFVCSFFKKPSRHQLTLLHICRLDATDMNATLQEMWEDPQEKMAELQTAGAEKALEKAKQMLSESEMAIDQILVKTSAERYGKVKDILHESSKGLYDAVILGKRASYTLQWIFDRPADETALSILNSSSVVIPFWICPEPEPGRKNVLVCVDGSENSYRAVDHAAYILSRQEQHSVTLFHVDNGAGLNQDAIFDQSIKILRDHDVTDERIKRDTTWGISIPATIMGYADKGGFAAIAVGLQGQDQGLLKSLNFAGGTASSLIKRIEKMSLWCCP